MTPTDIRMPPHSTEAEQMVIGGLLLSPDAWDRVADVVAEDSPYKGIAEAIIRKHRMGECGTVMLSFQPQYSRFHDADKGALADAARVANTTRQGRSPARRGFEG